MTYDKSIFDRYSLFATHDAGICVQNKGGDKYDVHQYKILKNGAWDPTRSNDVYVNADYVLKLIKRCKLVHQDGYFKFIPRREPWEMHSKP